MHWLDAFHVVFFLFLEIALEIELKFFKSMFDALLAKLLFSIFFTIELDNSGELVAPWKEVDSVSERDFAELKKVLHFIFHLLVKKVFVF